MVNSSWMVLGSFFASREPCRLPEGLLLAETLHRVGEIPCSLSIRAGPHFVITPARRIPGSPEGAEAVEVADYDPVRHTALVIGLAEPSPDTPIHWLSYWTDELVGAVSFVWSFHPPEGIPCTTESHPPGSFREAMSVVRLAREHGKVAGIRGRGVLMMARSAEELVNLVGELALETRLLKGVGNDGARDRRCGLQNREGGL
ncbi:MAG: hypothetical protein QXH42_04965 [Thermoplasmata archaeon]